MKLAQSSRLVTFRVPRAAMAPLVPDLDAAVARRISADNAAMDTLRVSFLQSPGKPTLDELQHCIGVARQPEFSLATGQRLVVRAPSGSIHISPVDAGTYNTYPFALITPAGSIFTAVRPVTFRTTGNPTVFGRLCATGPIIDATRAADAAAG